METLDLLTKVFGRWGFSLQRVCPELAIAGSPDRAMGRELLEAEDGRKFVLERLPLEAKESRGRQAQTLQGLVRGGLGGIAPWLSPRPGEFGVEEEGFFWQLRHWIPGEPLPRESYAQDEWRGKSAAQFLLELRRVSQEQGEALPAMQTTAFRLEHYIEHLMEHFQRLMPALVKDMSPMVEELKPFAEYEHAARTAFCHGDFHPGNILWKTNGIHGVIDWEFCGPKIPAYDLANLLGCLGVDDPANLTGPMALALVQTLQEQEYLSPEDWHFLPDLIAALRFAWMREWVARKDREMIIQELDFLWLVLDNRELLRARYGTRAL